MKYKFGKEIPIPPLSQPLLKPTPQKISIINIPPEPIELTTQTRVQIAALIAEVRIGLTIEYKEWSLSPKGKRQTENIVKETQKGLDKILSSLLKGGIHEQ